MMENRAYEDEANKSGHRHHLQHPQQFHDQRQQQYFNHIMRSHHPQQQQQQQQQQRIHHQEDDFSRDPPQISEGGRHLHPHQLVQPRFDGYRGLEMPQHTADCHVYEDIVAPYGLALEPGGGGGFQRNLTLPLRRTSQSCESIETNPQSSSVRVTNRERTRGSVIDRLTRDDRNHDSGHDDSIASGTSSNSAERPQRRRRKKDCKHCKIKAIARSAEEAKQRDELAVYEERSAELRAIFGLPEVGLCRLAPGCLGAGVVYAIGCNATDCSGSIMNGGAGDGLQSTMPRFAHVQPAQQQQQQQHQDGNASLQCDDKALITPPPGSKGSCANGRSAGMKVNSIYAQEHWHAAKDPRIFLNDPKEQSCNSPFQRAYSAVSANSPSSDNRANLRRSVRDEPAPHPARLRKHRHGWTLHFGRPLNGTTCTKSLVLLLIVVLALLGIGGIALYIVFEPEKLHVIQQYLRSTARNSTPGRENSLTNGQDLEERVFPTSLPNSSFLDAILNATVSTLNSNNLPGSVADDDLDDTEPIFITAWSTPPSTSTIKTTTAKPSTTRTSLSITSTTHSTTSTTTTTARSFLESSARRRRPCHECYPDEVCVARNADEVPYCRPIVNPQDASGCAGYCDDKSQKCHKLEGGAFRCMEVEHHCLDDEWTCLNIFCIPLVKRCDGQMNCYDHSDEYNCECNLETHFHCGNQTSCLPLSKKCDGHVDCFDASDEENCTPICPLGNEFTCRNKQQCIKRSRFCDGYPDCKDGSDEPSGCNGRCNKHEFTCHNGRCIDKADKCNGIDDCGDRSDEQHCRERL